MALSYFGFMALCAASLCLHDVLHHQIGCLVLPLRRLLAQRFAGLFIYLARRLATDHGIPPFLVGIRQRGLQAIARLQELCRQRLRHLVANSRFDVEGRLHNGGNVLFGDFLSESPMHHVPVALLPLWLPAPAPLKP